MVYTLVYATQVMIPVIVVPIANVEFHSNTSKNINNKDRFRG